MLELLLHGLGGKKPVIRASGTAAVTTRTMFGGLYHVSTKPVELNWEYPTLKIEDPNVSVHGYENSTVRLHISEEPIDPEVLPDPIDEGPNLTAIDADTSSLPVFAVVSVEYDNGDVAVSRCILLDAPVDEGETPE